MRSRWLAASLVACLGCRGNMAPWLLREYPDAPASVALASRVRDTESVDTLGLAANAIEAGRPGLAADHLRQHIRDNPDGIMIRACLAELCQKHSQPREAEYHFSRFIDLAQGGIPAVRDHTIHCHTRLMELAIVRRDERQEHLHRGIGLYLLARKAALKSAAIEPEIVESMYGRAIGELTAATERGDDDARAWWYLSRVWEELDQPQAVRRCATKAASLVETSTMTRTEKAALRDVLDGERSLVR